MAVEAPDRPKLLETRSGDGADLCANCRHARREHGDPPQTACFKYGAAGWCRCQKFVKLDLSTDDAA